MSKRPIRERPISVWVGGKPKDGDENTGSALFVAPSNNEHVDESDAAWVRNVLNDPRVREMHPAPSASPVRSPGLAPKETR
jgi:hypothetical protein